MRISCTLDIDDSGIVTIYHAKTGVVLAKYRHEPAGFGTYLRIDPKGSYDCDNYWIAVKPADSEVFGGGLFNGRKRLRIASIDYEILP